MVALWKPYPAHPFTDIFPMRVGSSLDEIVESIREHGLLEEIVLYCGQVLDGRLRQKACEKAGVKPLYRDFGDHAGDGPDALGWMIAKNLHRRHLSKAERALAAAKIANMRRGHNQHTTLNGQKPVSRREAAAKFEVNDHTLDRAARVLHSGVPELEQAVLAEIVSVSDAAAIAGEDPDVQRQALAAVEAGEAGTLRAAVATFTDAAPASTPREVVAGVGSDLDRCIKALNGLPMLARSRDAEVQRLAIDAVKSARSLIRRLAHTLNATA